jgi:hypothetical protein
MTTTMSPRLAVEMKLVRETLALTDRATLFHAAANGQSFGVVYHVRTLVRDDYGVVKEVELDVPVGYELAESHPAVPPFAVALQRDLFCPNINDPRQPSSLPPIPLLCLGKFRVHQRVADWLPATYYLLAWARITTHEGLNPLAMEFARRAMGSGRIPTDRRPFFRTDAARRIP